MICPCGGKSYDTCCGKFISGKKEAKTVEEMMRSRYSAYATGNIDYIYKTMHPKDQADFDFKAAEEWSKESKWLNFEIVRSKEGTATDKTGVIEFIARYEVKGKIETHHELSTFEKIDGKWYFTDGKLVREPITNAGEKIGRNDDCPCGSGKKYKKCCG